MSSEWNYNKSSDLGPKYWKKKYPNCGLNNQSPIDIETDKTRVCNLLCGLKINYKPSSCNVNNYDNLINILYDKGSYVTYKSENSVKYQLDKMVPHVPSLHTINKTKYEMELCLYHTNSDGKILIISVLINSNNNFSYSQDFLNQFIPGLKNQNYSGDPNNNQYDYSIGVANNWNAVNVLPVLRNFFVYKGTLPYPPCSKDVLWIIFENSVNISPNDLKILKERLIYNNSRKIYPLNSNPKLIRYVYYNNNIGVGFGSKTKGKIYIKCKKIEEQKNNYTVKKNDKSNSTKKGQNNNKKGKEKGKDTKTSENFFDSTVWKNLKFLIIWIGVFYICYIFLVPSIGYSFTFNKTLTEFVGGKKIMDTTYNKDMSSEDVRKVIEKFLFKKKRIIDLSTDTWFNQYLIRIPYSIFSSIVNSISGSGRAPDNDD